jgi:hypothetical protein
LAAARLSTEPLCISPLRPFTVMIINKKHFLKQKQKVHNFFFRRAYREGGREGFPFWKDSSDRRNLPFGDDFPPSEVPIDAKSTYLPRYPCNRYRRSVNRHHPHSRGETTSPVTDLPHVANHDRGLFGSLGPALHERKNKRAGAISDVLCFETQIVIVLAHSEPVFLLLLLLLLSCRNRSERHIR